MLARRWGLGPIVEITVTPQVTPMDVAQMYFLLYGHLRAVFKLFFSFFVELEISQGSQITQALEKLNKVKFTPSSNSLLWLPFESFKRIFASCECLEFWSSLKKNTCIFSVLSSNTKNVFFCLIVFADLL